MDLSSAWSIAEQYALKCGDGLSAPGSPFAGLLDEFGDTTPEIPPHNGERKETDDEPL